jgi:site-specific DNA-methyltransferase (cytosine-N4-specific)
MKTLLAFLESARLHLCQEFICFNPAKLPSPAQWVTVERQRVKDAFTRAWWMSPSERPKADNRRVLTAYSQSMKDLLRRGTYNFGSRPSEHHIGTTSFLSDNGGAIVPNVLVPIIGDDLLPDLLEVLPASNTRSGDPYLEYCRNHNIKPHPARMPERVAEFFIRFLTEEGDLVMDPFAGSNTTGIVAERLKRKWISIEANAEYASASRSRFDHSKVGPRYRESSLIPSRSR